MKPCVIREKFQSAGCPSSRINCLGCKKCDIYEERKEKGLPVRPCDR